jgi:predicted amidohydrolase YtcJ
LGGRADGQRLMHGSLVIRKVEIDGQSDLDVSIRNGSIAEIGYRLTRANDEIDGQGGALIPGLHDHHCHLLAAAARSASVILDGVRDMDVLVARLTAAANARPAGAWIRATGCPAPLAELLNTGMLDKCAPRHPLRILDRTGGLWVLNSLAMAVIDGADLPPCVERAADGNPTGRIWRGDAWLGSRVGNVPPPLGPIGKALSALGVTGLTDASRSNDAGTAALLAQSFRDGVLPQRLMLMSGGHLEAPADHAFAVGPSKILLDERDLPPVEELGALIISARGRTNRPVAIHCVSAAELAVTLAAFEMAGTRKADRLEHGSVIPTSAIPVIAKLGLTVVTQPGFIHTHGDRYLAEVDPAEHDDLYRCATLLSAGIPVAGSSDAPYAGWDCWRSMRAAMERKTADGLSLGSEERIAPLTALNLFCGKASDPGGAAPRVEPGVRADLCLLDAPRAEVVRRPDAERVAATIIGGRIVYRR